MVRPADYVNEDTSNIRSGVAPEPTTDVSRSPKNADDHGSCVDPDPTENFAAERNDADDCDAVTEPPSRDLPTIISANLIAGVKPSVGDVIAGRYVIERCLPGSGMGQIYKARDKCRDEISGESPYVALKFSAAAAGDDSGGVAAVKKEFQKLSRLRHPNIVQLIDIGVHNDAPFIVMEWLNGKSLLQVLDEQSSNRMALSRAQLIIRSIASGLAYAHEMNIVHGDIKPSNVFVSKRDGIKLLDFGASVAGDDDTVEESWATKAYASVNVLSGSAATKSDDVYSLGVTAYLLLSGKRPFGSRNALEASQNNLEPEPLPDDSSDAWSAIQSALSFDESLRQPDAGQFLASYKTENREQDAVAEPKRAIDFRYAAAASVVLLLVLMWWLRLDNLASTEIRQDIRRADAAMQLGMLVEPENESALHFYRQALAKSPQNRQALEGLDDIADGLLMRAGESLDNGELEAAKQDLSMAERVSPGHPALPYVTKLLDRHAADLIVRAGLVANADPDGAEPLLQRAENLTDKHADRIAALRESISAAKIDREINRLIAGIDERILAERLAVPRGDSAIDLLRQARELRPSDPRLPPAANRIVSALIFQALFAISHDKLERAAGYLESAKSLNVRHLAMARAEYELARARNRAVRAKYAVEGE